jgi:hypothetical protein
MQHLISSHRGEDVEDEVSNEDVLQRNPEGDDVLSEAGGIRPRQRVRSRLALSLSEREVISRGVVAGRSMRSIAAADSGAIAFNQPPMVSIEAR